MYNMLLRAGKFIFSFNSARKTATTISKVYNASSPLDIVKKGAIMVSEVCLPPNIKYPLKCSILLCQITILATGSATGISIPLAFSILTQIAESELED